MPIYEYYCQECEKRFDVKAAVREKERGLKVKCLYCGSDLTVQVFGSFFTFPKGEGSSPGNGCCGPNPTPGCCG